jgi:membrane protease subunit (stomatin/prohibitin family)
MGLWDAITGQFIDVISWLDDTGDTLVWRFPDNDNEIKMGAKLTVRESQVAVFVNEGRVADVFRPGLYNLSTQNMPIMTTLRSWKYGFESPFKAEVYFVNTKNFLDLKWGTQTPIMMRDAEFGMVRLRAFGTYGIRVMDPTSFIREVVGTQANFTTDEIEGQLRSIVVSAFSSHLASSGIAALDLAANYRSLSEKSRQEMATDYETYGLALTRFVIESISLPPEVQKLLDARTQMSVVGDLSRFTQLETAKAISDAANNPGSGGDFVGIGAGMALGRQMAAAMSEAAAPQKAPDHRTHETFEAKGIFCAHCGKKVENANFCPECGTPQSAKCPKCSNPVGEKDNFCKECGTKLMV